MLMKVARTHTYTRKQIDKATAIREITDLPKTVDQQ